MNQITFSNQISGAEYNELRNAVGFVTLSQGQAERGLAHTTFLAAARDEERIVAMGRVLFDFGNTAYIGDILVRPEYQGQRIGSHIVQKLIDETLSAACEGDRIMFILGAAKGKEVFYEKLGFLRRPNDLSGHGMSMAIIK